MEKIKDDSITLFLFNILKLLCFNFLYIYLFSYINVCIELFGLSHLRATVLIPRGDPGFKSRMRPLYPQHVVNRDTMGRFLGITA